MTELSLERKKRSKRRPLVVLIAILVAFLLLSWFRAGAAPRLEVTTELPGIGPRAPITVRAEEPERGLSGLRVELVQGERIVQIEERRHEPRPFWAFWGPRVAADELVAEIGAKAVPELVEGEAILRVTAERAPTWLRRPAPVVHELKLPVDLTPPRLEVDSPPVYVTQGGSAAVVYRVGEDAVRDGVRVSVEGETELRFPGYPLPGGEAGDRFALFGAPFNLDDDSGIRLAASDALGNERTVRFVDRYRARPPTADTIRLSDRFMAKVVPEIAANSAGVEEREDLLASYLAINRDLRRANTRTLFDLAGGTRPEFLWRRPFRQLPNSRSMASFADRRTYLYDGREVDHQTHLGFDLASVRQAPVLAANRGVVMLAEYFGIYGNTVVLDHGYGLMSLYAHLSRIDVETGQEVEHGEALGTTGETGLAGGDHLHFSMLLHGLQVDPIEWWDGRWIENRIAGALGDALTLEP